MLQPLEDLDLTGNIHAVWAVKDELVMVEFALAAGTLESAVGANRYAGGDVLCGEAGDWLVQYAPGDHGVVAQDRFARVYRVLDGELLSA